MPLEQSLDVRRASYFALTQASFDLEVCLSFPDTTQRSQSPLRDAPNSISTLSVDCHMANRILQRCDECGEGAERGLEFFGGDFGDLRRFRLRTGP